MNDYGFDYMNYINSIPNNINYAINNQKIPSYKNQQKESNKTVNPTEGWLKGNLFKDSYEPYKNYKPAIINPQNEKEALLYQVMQYKFALTELDLYLDTHPDDEKAICLHKEYCNKYRKLADQYQKIYGPLTIMFPCNKWRWLEEPWPWERGNF